jgi:hypothetical protein
MWLVHSSTSPNRSHLISPSSLSLMMFTLTRCRKTPPKPAAERLQLHDLPDDILILIYSACTVEALVALRLTDRRSKDLISEYINTIAPLAAHTSFPGCSNLLLHRPLRYTVQWLRDLIPCQLAAILVDRHRIAHDSMQQRYGIPAEDTHGDELRARIANGWRVLYRLTSISTFVPHADDPKPTNDLVTRLLCPLRRLDMHRQRDNFVLEQRLKYIDSMPIQDAKDYKLMFMLLSSAFRTSMSNVGEEHKPWAFDWGSGIDGQRLFRKGSSWLAWFVLTEGPGLFYSQWWTLPPDTPETRHYIRDRALAAWMATPHKLVDCQREHARRIQEAINSKAAVSTDFVSVNPIPYFTQYAEHRLAQWKSGRLPPKEILSHVPFHIEFRCPEELLQQYQLLLQDKEDARTNSITARR